MKKEIPDNIISIEFKEGGVITNLDIDDVLMIIENKRADIFLDNEGNLKVKNIDMVSYYQVNVWFAELIIIFNNLKAK